YVQTAGAFQSFDSTQCLGHGPRMAVAGAHLTEFVPRMVVAMNQKREMLRTLLEQTDCPRVQAPRIQWHGGNRDVKLILSRLLNEFAVGQEAVRRPVQIGIIEHETRTQRGLRPSQRRRYLPQEMQQWQQLHEMIAVEVVERLLAVGELRQRRRS